MSPILFLDIDGVLNTFETHRQAGSREIFSKRAVEALTFLMAHSDFKVVISSSWSEDAADRIAPVFTKNNLAGFLPRIIGATPKLHQAPDSTRRADEIEAWLDMQPEKTIRYVIFDDDPAALHAGNAILIDPNIGLTMNHAKSALEVYSRPDLATSRNLFTPFS